MVTEIVILMQDYDDKSSVRILHLPNQPSQTKHKHLTAPTQTAPTQVN